MAGKTSMRAAEEANLYEAFFYLASVNAVDSLKIETK